MTIVSYNTHKNLPPTHIWTYHVKWDGGAMVIKQKAALSMVAKVNAYKHLEGELKALGMEVPKDLKWKVMGCEEIHNSL